MKQKLTEKEWDNEGLIFRILKTETEKILTFDSLTLQEKKFTK